MVANGRGDQCPFMSFSGDEDDVVRRPITGVSVLHRYVQHGPACIIPAVDAMIRRLSCCPEGFPSPGTSLRPIICYEQGQGTGASPRTAVWLTSRSVGDALSVT